MAPGVEVQPEAALGQVTVDTESVEKIKAELSNHSIEQLENEQKKVDSTFWLASQQAGENNDISKIEVIGGATVGEKMLKFKELHNRSAAVNEMLTHKREMEGWNKSIRRRNIAPSGDAEDVPENQVHKHGFGTTLCADAFGERGSDEALRNYNRARQAFNNRSVTFESERTTWDDETLNERIDMFGTLFGIKNISYTGDKGTVPVPPVAPSQMIVDGITPMPDLVDIIPQFPWNQNEFPFYRELNKAASDADYKGIGPGVIPWQLTDSSISGAQGSEEIADAEFDLVPRSTDKARIAELKEDIRLVRRGMRTIAGYMRIPDELIEDFPALRAYVDRRVGYRVRQKLNSEIVVAIGGDEELSGLLRELWDGGNPGNTGTAKTGANKGDGGGMTYANIKTGVSSSTAFSVKKYQAIGRCLTDVRAKSHMSADTFITSPTFWFDSIGDAADGSFYFPQIGMQNQLMPRAWGRRVVESTEFEDIHQLKPTTGKKDDSNQAQLVGIGAAFSDNVSLYVRRRTTSVWGMIHDDFIRDMNAVKASIRCAFVVEQPGALRGLIVGT